MQNPLTLMVVSCSCASLAFWFFGLRPAHPRTDFVVLSFLTSVSVRFIFGRASHVFALRRASFTLLRVVFSCFLGLSLAVSSSSQILFGFFSLRGFLSFLQSFVPLVVSFDCVVWHLV
ncbi:hypothetical protein V1525DRAFT_415568 [Lipomyces kononenkoae]|uniref:Uncharacterized protein n=1 Tax=Lipomyces kononenkoae TaxID=34357 RepID=A0ACC3SPZ2_LIPKO